MPDGAVAVLPRVVGDAGVTGPRRRLQVEPDLEQRRAGCVPAWRQFLHQPLERGALVGEGVQADLPHPVQQLAERRVAAGVHPQHQPVDEQPDDPLQLRAVPAGDRRADDHLRLAGGPVQQHRVRRQEGHEQRRPVPAAEVFQRPRHVGGYRHLAAAAGGPGRRRPGPVGRQVEGRQAGEVLAPVRQRLGAVGSVDLPPLPGGVVGVLDPQRLQRGRPAGGQGCVRLLQILDHHQARPGVGDQVVDDEDQLVGGVAAEQPCPQQRPDGEVERPPGLLLAPASGLRRLVVGGPATQVGHGQVDLGRAQHDLHGRAVPFGEDGPQALVPADHFPEAPTEQARVGARRQRHRDVDVVCRLARVELLQEPQLALRVRGLVQEHRRGRRGDRVRHSAGAPTGSGSRPSRCWSGGAGRPGGW